MNESTINNSIEKPGSLDFFFETLRLQIEMEENEAVLSQNPDGDLAAQNEQLKQMVQERWEQNRDADSRQVQQFFSDKAKRLQREQKGREERLKNQFALFKEGKL